MDLSISLPLDGDGFLDRACENCERHFRWVHTEMDEPESGASSEVAYYCPYCRNEAGPSNWNTREQQDAMERIASAAIQSEMSVILTSSFGRLSSSDFLKVSISDETSTPPAPLFIDDSDELQAIASPCHPDEPVKVPVSWAGVLYCLTCGGSFLTPPL